MHCRVSPEHRPLQEEIFSASPKCGISVLAILPGGSVGNGSGLTHTVFQHYQANCPMQLICTSLS